MKELISKFKNMDNKKNLVLLLVAGITLIIVTLGATYAYFQAQGTGGANIDTDVITGTTDLLSFSFGDEINIVATEENFAEGMPSLSDSTTGSAILRANNTTNSATATYNIYLIIESNDFEYTTEEGTPELLLNVTDPNGMPVENITGLVHYENGFDITTRTGGFLLIPDYEITATNVETIQDWLIEVTFVNLDSDQNANTGKTLTGKLYITQDQMSSYELTQINNIESTTSYNSINATLDITNGSGAVSKYYYGIEEATGTRSAETVEYVESDSASYEFANLKSNTEYTIYSYVVDENKIKSNVYSTNVTTSDYENPTIDNVTHSVTLNSITVNVTASGGSNNVSKYMYKIDDNDWVESETNSYTFTNLIDTTEYDIRIKVVDSENHESTEYYEAITTEVYILPTVTSVDATTTWNSITLTPSGTDGTNVIDHYEYSINNGAYQTSNVFNSLSENTDYTIKVKAIDSIGRESNVYETTVRTDTYKLPTISVTTSATENSITVRVSATPGDGNIVSYHYSRNDGSNYTSSSNSSHTFSGLTSGTTYYLKVYVTDSNGRTSAVTAKTQATTYINPSVSNVTASNITSDSIKINVTASGGSNSISRYYYSSNNGASWVNSTSSSYTFTNLSPGTRYTFRVYVVDTKGTKSNEKTVSGTTTYVNPTVSSVTTSDITTDSITLKVTASGGTNSVKTYYYSKDNGSSYVNSTSSSYTFSSLSAGTTYNFKVYVKDSAGYSSSTKSISATTEDNTLASYIKSLYTSQGENDLYYHDSSLTNSAGDNSYRYAGRNPNNYVCFGSDAATCPEDNLYRIIGVFNNSVKLLKSTSATSSDLGTNGTYDSEFSSEYYYFWSNTSSNNWSQSELNTVNLNTNFINNIGSNWSSLIATYTWYVGAYARTDGTAKGLYNNEISGITWNGKIGLMYASDYGYAADAYDTRYWTEDLYAHTEYTSSYNWISTDINEWLISPSSWSSSDAFYRESFRNGHVINGYVKDSYLVRPTFYLNENVEYVSGSGTQYSPFRIT